MLNLGKIAANPTAGLYYVQQLARGVEDYYAENGEAPGRWVGAGARSLGLDGEVDEDGILRLLSARDPASGERLRRPLASGAVAGFDLTFRALAERLGAVELREVRRQRAGWDRDALAELRAGDVERFARDYHDHGRIVAAPTAEEAKAALVEDWWKAGERGERGLMIAHRRSDVADLNQRARARMRDAGRIGPDELVAGERAFAAGDRVATTRNDRRLHLVNGQTGTITAIGDGRLRVDLDRGDSVELPARYLRAGHLDHAYASTAHRAQGATVDRAFVLGSDELYREWGYTALSRHQDEARFYVTAGRRFLNEAPEPLRTREDVASRVTWMLSASRAEGLATHGVERDHVVGALEERLDAARQQLVDHETQLEALQDERSETRWYRRGARAEIDRATANSQRGRARWRDEVDRLTDELAQRSERHEPTLRCARDPLARLDAAEELEREMRRSRALRSGRDLGIGL